MRKTIEELIKLSIGAANRAAIIDKNPRREWQMLNDKDRRYWMLRELRKVARDERPLESHGGCLWVPTGKEVA